jgi:hypothetical protein
MTWHEALTSLSYRLLWSSLSARIAAIQRRVRERDQHLDGAAGVVEPDSA